MIKSIQIAPFNRDITIVTVWEQLGDWRGKDRIWWEVTSIYSPELDRAWTDPQFLSEFGADYLNTVLDCSVEMTAREEAQYIAECLAAKNKKPGNASDHFPEHPGASLKSDSFLGGRLPEQSPSVWDATVAI